MGLQFHKTASAVDMHHGDSCYNQINLKTPKRGMFEFVGDSLQQRCYKHKCHSQRVHVFQFELRSVITPVITGKTQKQELSWIFVNNFTHEHEFLHCCRHAQNL